MREIFGGRNTYSNFSVIKTVNIFIYDENYKIDNQPLSVYYNNDNNEITIPRTPEYYPLM